MGGQGDARNGVQGYTVHILQCKGVMPRASDGTRVLIGATGKPRCA